MKQSVSDIYHQVEYTDKGLAVVDLKTSTISETQLSLNVQTITGNKGIKPPWPVVEGPFKEGDDWWYGEMIGRCNEFLGNSDAAQQLMMALNASLPDPTGNFYVINSVFKERTGGYANVRRPNDPLDNNFDYYLYYASEAVGPVDLCLERNTMNFYYNHLQYLGLEKIKEDEGLGSMYSLIGITGMFGSYFITNPYGNTSINYYHQGTFHYGIKVYYMDGGAASEL
jgi:hypothetical protein